MTSRTTATPPPRPASSGAITFSLVGVLFLVEITSGILQGYYVPLISDLVLHLGIRDADFNWFEAAQLLLAGIVVPVMAKLGDMYGHKRMLLIATAITAVGTWWLAFAGDFWSFLAAWALQGFLTVWLPLEVALIFDRGRRTGTAASQTRRAAAMLIVALEAGAIVGALAAGRVFAAVGEQVGVTLAVPAVAVTLVFFAVWRWVPESEPLPGRRLDVAGFALLTTGLLLITSGLTFLRINGPGTWWVWALMLLGLLAFVPFARHELRVADPAIDLRTLAQPTLWPVVLTAGLLGVSLLGAQAPLSTYAGTDPALGYGLGLAAADRSLLIGVYLLSMIVGALLFPLVSRRVSPRFTLFAAALLVGVGFLMFLPLHTEVWHVVLDMVVVGIGSGALMGALPSAAAAAAPRGQTGVATGLTNTSKTVGGAFASAVFGIVLVAGAGTGAGTGTAGSLSGYLTVWVICGVAGLAAAVALMVVPRLAFGDEHADALER